MPTYVLMSARPDVMEIRAVARWWQGVMKRVSQVCPT